MYIYLSVYIYVFIYIYIIYIYILYIYNHQQSFRNENYKSSTALPTYLWSINSTSKEENINLSCELIQIKHFKSMLVMFE